MAAKKKTKDDRRRSGIHIKPRRLVTQSEEAFAFQEEAAAADGFKDWGSFVKAAATEKAEKVLGRKLEE